MAVEIVGDGIKYPILCVRMEDPKDGKQWLLGPCCFYDLLGKDIDHLDLAGMGLAIIGNVCQGLANGSLKERFNGYLDLIMAPGSPPVKMPWPGMPTDNPNLKLDLTEVPFDVAMFLDKSDGKYKRRPDRLQLMDRIQMVWVPYLKLKMAFSKHTKRPDFSSAIRESRATA